MKRTGEILRKAREEKDLSLHEIGLSLKINNKVLKAIEDGDMSKLPAKTFLRGFVRSYATFLNLNTEEVLAVFYEEMGSTKPTPYKREDAPKVSGTPTVTPDKVTETAKAESEVAPLTDTKKSSEPPTSTFSESVTPATESPKEAEPKVVTTPAKTPKAETTSKEDKAAKGTYAPSGNPDIVRSSQAISSLDKKSNLKTYIGLAAVAALIVVIIFVKEMIDKYSKEAQVPSSEVAQTIENATPLPFDPTENTLTEVEQTPSPVITETSATGIKADTPVQSPTTAPPATVAAPSVPTTATTTTTPPTPPTAAAPAPSPTTPAANPAVVKKEEAKPAEAVVSSGKPVELIVEALDGVEIEYSAPNGVPQKIKLSSEQVHTFKSKSGLIIKFSNGGVVNLILNGKEVGIPGDLGKPVKLSY